MTSNEKKTWVIGNWKSNPVSLTEATSLSRNIVSSKVLQTLNSNLTQAQLMLIPNTLHIQSVADVTKDQNILAVGCQDVSYTCATTGAFTGDCSSQQLREAGANWTLIGHSERRQYHAEDNDILSKKIKNAFEQNLGVILCIGESLSQYQDNETISVLKAQLDVLKTIDNINNNAYQIIIAYEPVWAIGTGKVPTVAEVEEVHQKINAYLLEIDSSLDTISIIYGGSVNPDNAQAFATSPWVNGALVGGASLVAEKFLQIAELFFTTKFKLLSDK